MKEPHPSYWPWSTEHSYCKVCPELVTKCRSIIDEAVFFLNPRLVSNVLRLRLWVWTSITKSVCIISKRNASGGRFICTNGNVFLSCSFSFESDISLLVCYPQVGLTADFRVEQAVGYWKQWLTEACLTPNFCLVVWSVRGIHFEKYVKGVTKLSVICPPLDEELCTYHGCIAVHCVVEWFQVWQNWKQGAS